MICRVCDANVDDVVLDLGNQPWCNHFLKPEKVGKEPMYPLRLLYCHNCYTSQLDYTVPKETMFGDHTYLSGVTRSLDEHFAKVSHDVDELFFKNQAQKSVLDIGSNDGTQLKHYQKLGYSVTGVESSQTTARIANDAGVPTVNAFFNSATAAGLGQKFDLINAAGVFFHLEELHDVTEAIRNSLNPGGVFVVQFLYMKRIIENLAFDQIYHEHLLYYNLKNFKTLLSRHGLEVFDAHVSPIHGGSVIAYCGHPGRRRPTDRLIALENDEEQSGCTTIDAMRQFSKDVADLKIRNLEYLRAKRAEGKRIFGMGAPVKGNTLLNYFGVGPDLIECLVERNALRRGLFAPGSHIPIRIEDENLPTPEVYYVLAWNFKREILQRYQSMIESGTEFYFPVDPEACRS
jgi:SAM-dependent methyltransferase